MRKDSGHTRSTRKEWPHRRDAVFSVVRGSVPFNVGM